MTHVLVLSARKYIGVRFQHQGRNAAALDCAGLIVVSLKDMGLTVSDEIAYGRSPAKNLIKTRIESNFEIMDEVENKDYKEGDIFLMRFINEPQHVAICSNEGSGIIHAYLKVGKVVEHDLDRRWKERITNVYRLKSEI